MDNPDLSRFSLACELQGTDSKAGPSASLLIAAALKPTLEPQPPTGIEDVDWEVTVEYMCEKRHLLVRERIGWSSDSLWSLLRFGLCVKEAGIRRDMNVAIDDPTSSLNVGYDAQLVFSEALISLWGDIRSDRFSELGWITLSHEHSPDQYHLYTICSPPEAFVRFGRSLVNMFRSLDDASTALMTSSRIETQSQCAD